jgi:hypothetical protein
MKDSPVHPRLCSALAAFAIGAGICGSAQAALPPRAGKSIQFAAPEENVTTNLNNRATKTSPLDNMRVPDQAPSGFSLRRPGEGVIAPVPPVFRSQQRTTEMKEMLERRNNWTFMTPEQLLGVPDEQDRFSRTLGGTDDEKEKQNELNLTPAERYFLDLPMDETSLGLNGEGKDNRDKKRNDRENDDSSLPENLRTHEENLRRLLGNPDTLGQSRTPGMNGLGSGLGAQNPVLTGFSSGFIGLGNQPKREETVDFFGFKSQVSAANELSEKRKAQKQELQKELGLPTLQGALQDLYKPPAAMDPAKAGATPGQSGFASTIRTKPATDFPLGGIAGPSLATIPDFGVKGPASLPNLSPPGFTAPINDSARVKPITPTFTPPKRVF